MTLKEKILKLRAEGKTYNEIIQVLNCSKGTVSFHLNPKVKEKQIQRQWRNRTKSMRELKVLHGGKCSICNYSKSWNALHFHHINPSTKVFEISSHTAKIAEMIIEAKKCVLICANCHSEVHEGITILSESGQVVKSPSS